MNQDELERLLVAQNPQWRGGIVPDVAFTHTRDTLEPLLADRVSHRLIMAVTGPRRIGKTYLVKQLLARLIADHGVSPINTLYVQFSAQHNLPHIISDLMTLYLSLYAEKQAVWYVGLDEVQYIDWWQDQVKELYDRYPNIRFTVTGSTSLFYRQKSKESLAGRLIKKPLNTLSFGEYLRFTNTPASTVYASSAFQLTPSARAQFISEIPVFRRSFVPYLVFGQMPELTLSAVIPAGEYLTNYIDQIMNFDIAYVLPGLNRTVLFQLVRALSGQIGTEYSINSLAGFFSVPRRDLTEYIRILEDVGLFKTCTNGYFRKLRAKLSASKKIYSHNANLALAVNGFTKEYLRDSRVFGQYVENYVFTRLLAKFHSVEYLREQGSSREIDFMADDYVIEVKSGEVGDISRYEELAGRKKKKLLIITESTVAHQGNVTYFPWYLL